MPAAINTLMIMRSIVIICKMAVLCGNLKDMRGFTNNDGSFHEDDEG